MSTRTATSGHADRTIAMTSESRAVDKCEQLSRKTSAPASWSAAMASGLETEGPSVAMILVLRTIKYRSSLGVEGGT